MYLNTFRMITIKSLKRTNSTFFFLPLVREFVLTGGTGGFWVWSQLGFLIPDFLVAINVFALYRL